MSIYVRTKMKLKCCTYEKKREKRWEVGRRRQYRTWFHFKKKWGTCEEKEDKRGEKWEGEDNIGQDLILRRGEARKSGGVDNMIFRVWGKMIKSHYNINFINCKFQIHFILCITMLSKWLYGVINMSNDQKIYNFNGIDDSSE